MLSTFVREEAARRLRHGLPWVFREEIVSLEGTPAPGETVMLRDERGQPLGIGDLDLEGRYAIRRIGLPGETPEGIIQRHVRRAMERRALLTQDPRFCRLVNDDGDTLPGLTVDRYDTHFAIQTLTPAMEARTEEIARALVQVLNARSILLRNPDARPHVLFGTPPRWMRVQELGARYTVDLFAGPGTGFPYDHRQIRRAIGRMSQGARVLDPACGIGASFVQAGLKGARTIQAYEADPDLADLAQENAEANGLLGRAVVENVGPFEALERVVEPYDLVLLAAPPTVKVSEDFARDDLVRMIRLAARATRRGGRMILSALHPPVPPGRLDGRIAYACELEGRIGTRLFRPTLPVDFPTVLGSGGEYLSAVAFELT